MPSSASSLRDRRGRSGQRIRAAGDLREGDDLAQVGLTREQRHEALDAEREPAVRRGAHLQRVEEPAELRIRSPRPTCPSRGRPPPGAPDDGSAASRSRAPSRSRPGRSAGSTPARDRPRSTPRGPRAGRVKGWWYERPAAGRPRRVERAGSRGSSGTRPASRRRDSSSSSEMETKRAEHALDSADSSSATNSTVDAGRRDGTHRARPLRGTSRSASAPRQPRRTRGRRAPSRPTPSRQSSSFASSPRESSCGTTR